MKNNPSISDDFAQLRDNPAIYLDLLQEEPDTFPAIIRKLHKEFLSNIQIKIDGSENIDPYKVIPALLTNDINDYCLANFFTAEKYEEIVDGWVERLNRLATTHDKDNHIVQHIAEMQDDHFYRRDYINKHATPIDLRKAEVKIAAYGGNYHSHATTYYKIQLLDKKAFELKQIAEMYDYVAKEFIEGVKNLRRHNVTAIKGNRYYRLMSTELIRIHAAERDLQDLIAKRQQLGLGKKPAPTISLTHGTQPS